MDRYCFVKLGGGVDASSTPPFDVVTGDDDDVVVGLA